MRREWEMENDVMLGGMAWEEKTRKTNNEMVRHSKKHKIN